MKSWLIGKDSDAGRDWGQEEKGTTEDEMAGWHHWLDGREPEWTPGDGDEQGGLVCCDSWGRKELDTTEWLNWTELRVHCGSSKEAEKGKAGVLMLTLLTICPCRDRSLKRRKRIGMGEIGLVYFFNSLFSSLLVFLLAQDSDEGLCLRTVLALLHPNGWPWAYS